MALHDAQGRLLFRGRYYDTRVVQSLAGDEALTPTGQRLVEHWQNGFGEGPSVLLMTSSRGAPVD
jgi:hypothetical protein